MKQSIRLFIKASLVFVMLMSSFMGAGLALKSDTIEAQSNTVNAVVLAQILYLRQMPTVKAPILAQLPQGTSITVQGYETDATNGGVWVYGQAAGQTGWVLSSYLQFPSDFRFVTLPVISIGTSGSTGSSTGNVPSTTGFATIGDVNFRTGPGLNFTIMRMVGKGTSLQPVGRNSVGDWVKVQIAGQEGWMYRTLTNISSTAIANLPVLTTSVTTPAGPSPVVSTGAVNYYPIGLQSRPEVHQSNDWDGRLNPYTYLTRGVIYCFDREGFTDRQNYWGGGIAVFLLYGNPQGVVFVATEDEINAKGIPASGSTLIESDSGFTLYRLSNGQFLMTGPNTNGTSFSHTWTECGPNTVTQKDPDAEQR